MGNICSSNPQELSQSMQNQNRLENQNNKRSQLPNNNENPQRSTIKLITSNRPPLNINNNQDKQQPSKKNTAKNNNTTKHKQGLGKKRNFFNQPQTTAKSFTKEENNATTNLQQQCLAEKVDTEQKLQEESKDELNTLKNNSSKEKSSSLNGNNALLSPKTKQPIRLNTLDGLMTLGLNEISLGHDKDGQEYIFDLEAFIKQQQKGNTNSLFAEVNSQVVDRISIQRHSVFASVEYRPLENPDYHIVCFFGSPGCYIEQSADKLPVFKVIPQIQWQKDISEIKGACKKNNLPVKFLAQVLRMDNFEAIIAKNTWILDISVHGEQDFIDIKKVTRGDMGIPQDAKQNSLAFEKANGEGEKITAQKIDSILKTHGAKLELVVLKACNSLNIGKVFQKYSKHCICIQEERYVRDDVANMFTQYFYGFLCQGDTICRAFERAKQSVKNKLKSSEEKEAELFTLLVGEKTHEQNRGYCYALFDQNNMLEIKKDDPNQKVRRFKCLNQHSLLKNCRKPDWASEMEVHKTRPQEKLDLINHINQTMKDQKRQLIIVYGPFGNGKKTLVHAVTQHMDERKVFSGGVIRVNMSKVTTTKMLLQKIKNKIKNQLRDQDLDALNNNPYFCKANSDCIGGDRNSLEQKKQMIDCLCDFLKQEKGFELTQNSNNDNCELLSQEKLPKKKFLIVLEDVYETWHNDKKSFKRFIQKIGNCKDTTLILTTHKLLLPLFDDVKDMIQLDQLDEHYSVELFKSKAGGIAKFKPKEVLDLVLKDPQIQSSNSLQHLYSLLKGKSDQAPKVESISQEEKNQLLEKLKSEQVQRETLGHHNMFKLMNGNPSSIITYARFYTMKFVDKNCLLTVYNRMREGDCYLGNESSIGPGDERPNIDHRVTNQQREEAQQRTNLVLIKTLADEDNKRHQGCLDLFIFMGISSIGFQLKTLKEIWNRGDEQLTISLNLLQQLGIIKSSSGHDYEKSRKTLNLSIRQAVQQTNFSYCSKSLMSNLCNYYTQEIFQRVYEGRFSVEQEIYRIALKKNFNLRKDEKLSPELISVKTFEHVQIKSLRKFYEYFIINFHLIHIFLIILKLPT